MMNLEKKSDYHKFLKKAFKYADAICLTYSENEEEFFGSEWSFLYESVSRFEHRIAPADGLGQEKVWLVYLKIDHRTMEWLTEKKNAYDFPRAADGSMLEDLCFVKNDEFVFISLTHEKTAYTWIAPELEG